MGFYKHVAFKELTPPPGVGALKQLSPDHGEIKSMRTAPKALGRGVGRKILHQIVTEARSRGPQERRAASSLDSCPYRFLLR